MRFSSSPLGLEVRQFTTTGEVLVEHRAKPLVLVYRRIGPPLDTGFFIFGSKCFRLFRQARNALGGTQGRGSLTTEEAGKNAKRFAPTFCRNECEAFLVRKFCSRERIVERKKGELSARNSAKKQVAAATCRVSFMVKLLRAYGGCLGARRR